MDVWVDGQNNFRVEGEPEDALVVFRAATDFLRGQGRMVTVLKVDGVSVAPDDVRARLEGVSPTQVQKIEVISEDTRTLVVESLRELEGAIAELPQLCRQLAEVFQGDAPSDGYEPFQKLAGIWGHVKTRQQLAASALELDLAAAEVKGMQVAALADELNGFLGEAAEALKRNDAVLLGDLLEYELAPRAELEAVIVAWLQERAAAPSA